MGVPVFPYEYYPPNGSKRFPLRIRISDGVVEEGGARRRGGGGAEAEAGAGSLFPVVQSASATISLRGKRHDDHD